MPLSILLLFFRVDLYTAAGSLLKPSLKCLRKFFRETLHAPENASEVRLILRALPLHITYVITQQNLPMCSVTLNITL